MHQATLAQLDDYGPWTTTPEPRPEMELQSLQSRLYADLADEVGRRGGYAFYARGDNLVCVTNGLDRAAHERVQSSLTDDYPVTVSLGVGTGPTPADALADATDALQSTGSAQGERRRALVGTFAADPAPVTVAHFDVVDATGRLTDAADAFAAHARMDDACRALRSFLRERDALTFFVGGDNAVAVTPELDAATYREACAHVERETDLPMRVGVGRGVDAREAGLDAKHALERAREQETTVAPAAAD